MADLEHKNLGMHPTDPAQKNLGPPGYSMADAAAEAAIVTQAGGDLLYREDLKRYFLFDGVSPAVSRPLGEIVANIINSDVLVPASCSMVVPDYVQVNAGKSLTVQAGGILMVL